MTRTRTKQQAAEGGGDKDKDIKIVPPRIATTVVPIEGVSPLIVHAFSAAAVEAIERAQGGGVSGTRPKRVPKDEYEACLGAVHLCGTTPETATRVK